MKASTDNIILQKGEVQSNGQTLYWESYGERQILKWSKKDGFCQARGHS